MTIEEQFAELEPWIFQFQIAGKTYGGGTSAVGDERVERFFQFAPNVKTILELGALEGAQTSIMASHPGVERVLALEGRERNLRKARLVQELLQIRNAEFVQANLEEENLGRFGTFDAVFCCGLLYHLPRPWELIAQLPAIAPILFLWTIYAPENDAHELPNGMRGKIHVEGGADEPLSGLSETATWLTLPCLRDRLTASGYKQIEVIRDEAHPNGPTVTIGALTSAAKNDAGAG